MSLNNKIGIKLTQMYMISPIDMDNKSIGPVSYTHLTLPTNYPV